MYSNMLKTSQAFPFVAIRFSSSKPTHVTTTSSHFYTLKAQSLATGSYQNPSRNILCVKFASFKHGFNSKPCKVSNFVRNTKCFDGFQDGVRVRDDGYGASCYAVRVGGFLRSYSVRVSGRASVVRAEKVLPWLNSRTFGEAKHNNSNDEGSVKRSKKGVGAKTVKSSWEGLVEADLGRKDVGTFGDKESRDRVVSLVNDNEKNYVDGEGEEALEEVDDPRWNKIQSRVGGMVGAKERAVRPESRRCIKQENWGRKTWKEATESTIPKMVGEGVYGVGPVLAALSAGRREFYALYVQEGLDLSGNNKKKKDKKGFEKVLKMAQKIGLTIKEVSKHDLNMVVDNRPHQGIVLDASPLEMVKIMELDPISHEDKGSLWVALDEVTDPQNLGAIIRSSYFFGATGVVLCAKNSAPLSGVVSKASAGSLEVMELRYCKNMMQFLVSSADNGWRVLGSSVSSKAVPLNEIPPGEPTILVLGSEGTGLRPLVERSCTQLVRIPGNVPGDVNMDIGNDDMETEQASTDASSKEFRSFLAVESLNVSVAAGVLLHQLSARKNDALDRFDPCRKTKLCNLRFWYSTMKLEGFNPI